ncbi:hypothetical protein ACFFRR_000750 [Megaselia abdita]
MQFIQLKVLSLFLCSFNYLNGLDEQNHKHKQQGAESDIYGRIFKRKIPVPPIQSIHPNHFLRSFDLHPCNRECKVNDYRECYFNLIIDYHSTLSDECGNCPNDIQDCFNHRCVVADGLRTSIMSVNYMYPGPSIEVCHNDTIIVDVLNRLPEPTSIHWHGLTQKETPWMDGVPFITQYPIQPGKTMRYRFIAENPGTYWYHSHYGMQRAWGVSGSLIFRQPKKLDSFGHFYDIDTTDQVIFLSDWAYNHTRNPIGNLLINGKGHVQRTNKSEVHSNFYAKFHVKEKLRYRFRVIFEGYSQCNVEFSIDNHTLLVISTDGNDLQPIEVESILLTSGERYDFVLEANQMMGNFWIRAQGQAAGCNDFYQGAVLNYRGSGTGTLPSGVITSRFELKGNQLNSVFDRFAGADDIPIHHAKGLDPFPYKSKSLFQTFYIHIKRMNGLFTMNDINFVFNNSISLLDAYEVYDDGQYTCNDRSLIKQGRSCKNELCSCPQMIHLPYNEYVELVIVNDMRGSHPMHMHGYSFHVVGQGEFQSEEERLNIEFLDEINPLPRNGDYPPLKDTVIVQSRGYTIIRFFTGNPGYWLFHCHIEVHVEIGMAVLFKVGDNSDICTVPWDAGIN